MSVSANVVILMGGLTRDPELKYLASGTAVCNLGLAIGSKYKKGDEWVEEVTYVDITVWGKTGENCAEYLAKGRQVYIEGRLNYRTWEDQDGKKRSKLDVVANKVNFLPAGQSQAAKAREGIQEEYSDGPRESDETTGDSTDDDLPF